VRKVTSATIIATATGMIEHSMATVLFGTHSRALQPCEVEYEGLVARTESCEGVLEVFAIAEGVEDDVRAADVLGGCCDRDLEELDLELI